MYRDGSKDLLMSQKYKEFLSDLQEILVIQEILVLVGFLRHNSYGWTHLLTNSCGWTHLHWNSRHHK